MGEEKAMEEKQPTNLANYQKLLDNSNEGMWLHVLDPQSGKFNGISIKLLGIDSDKFQELNREMQRKMMKRATSSKRKFQGMRGMRDDVALTDEEIRELEDENLRKVVVATVAWQTDDLGEVIADGEEQLPCTPENAQRVYTKHPWLREQVEDFVGARENFF